MISTGRSLLLGASLLAGVWMCGAPGCGGSSKGNQGASGAPGDPDGGQPVSSTGGGMGNGGAPGAGGVLGSGGGMVATDGGGADRPLAASDAGSPLSCGGPGLPCCDGNACTGGGCCVAGICMAVGGSCVGLGGGICSNGACGDCGGLGFPCCGANPSTGVCTAPNTACSGGACAKCGDLGAICCGGASGGTGRCNGNGAICGSGNVCLSCGTPGSQCCPGSQCASPSCCYNNVCAGEGAACGTSGICQAGRCSGCGNASQPCCANVCYGGLLCKNGACAPCGAAGEICCPASASTSECQSGAACTSDGLCARCGNAGDICCPGNACNGGCCQGGRCMAPSACPAPPDGGSADVPLGGSDGSPGTGGRAGTGGVGTGGVTGVGTGGVIGTGGTSTPWTVPAGCGDGVPSLPERCDDGNTMPFDGCSSDCQPEPRCVGNGPCTSTCGDGIVVGEDCDDGNTTDGDGCSSSCKVEAGFTCSQPPIGDRIQVPVVYRDFKFRNPPDFNPGVSGSERATAGMVERDLNAKGKPVYSNLPEPPSNVRVQSAATFATWYENTDNVNHATATRLALWDNHNGAYVNRYGANGEPWPLTQTAMWCGSPDTAALDDSGNPIPCTYKYSVSFGGTGQTDCEKLAAQGFTMLKCITSELGSYRGIFLQQYVDGNPLFFPVDGDTFSASDKTYAQIPSTPKGMYDTSATWPYDVDDSGKQILHNFSFTSEIRYWFKYDANASYTLDIVGDDDVWVFVNGKLAVDLGGIHTPVAGSVTLDAATSSNYGLESGNVYQVAVFQAERQTYSSTFKITLAGFNLAPSECHPN